MRGDKPPRHDAGSALSTYYSNNIFHKQNNFFTLESRLPSAMLHFTFATYTILYIYISLPLPILPHALFVHIINYSYRSCALSYMLSHPYISGHAHANATNLHLVQHIHRERNGVHNAYTYIYAKSLSRRIDVVGHGAVSRICIFRADSISGPRFAQLGDHALYADHDDGIACWPPI